MKCKEVVEMCERLGYGYVMQQASWGWKEKDNTGYHTKGPCGGLTVPCECENIVGCDWCCGCGWLTEKVKEIKDQYNKEEKTDD